MNEIGCSILQVTDLRKKQTGWQKGLYFCTYFRKRSTNWTHNGDVVSIVYPSVSLLNFQHYWTDFDETWYLRVSNEPCLVILIILIYLISAQYKPLYVTKIKWYNFPEKSSFFKRMYAWCKIWISLGNNFYLNPASILCTHNEIQSRS